MIPFLGIKRQYENLREEILAATDHAWSTGQVLDGFYTHEFEDKIAERCHRQYAVAVNSGTQGLIFAQQALGLESKKILIPGMSFVATLNSVIMANNEPIICDTDSDFLLDLYKANQFIEAGYVNAIMYVNIFGNIIDYDQLRTLIDVFYERMDIPIIEDAAQSFGATYNGIPSGKLGNVSVLSFDPTKNLNNYGSGGMVLTDNPMVYNNLRDLRDNGKYLGFVSSGTNSKMSESDCAGMLVKLNYFDQWQNRRTEIAEFYTEYLSDYVTPVLPQRGVESSWHKYVITLKDNTKRIDLQQFLKEQGVETKVHYENTLADYSAAGAGYNYMPTASNLASCCLSLPIYPELTDAEVEHITQCVVDFHEAW